jgi:hypothetical protein
MKKHADTDLKVLSSLVKECGSLMSEQDRQSQSIMCEWRKLLQLKSMGNLGVGWEKLGTVALFPETATSRLFKHPQNN